MYARLCDGMSPWVGQVWERKNKDTMVMTLVCTFRDRNIRLYDDHTRDALFVLPNLQDPPVHPCTSTFSPMDHSFLHRSSIFWFDFLLSFPM